MNKLNEKIFKNYLTKKKKCDIVYIEIKKGGHRYG